MVTFEDNQVAKLYNVLFDNNYEFVTLLVALVFFRKQLITLFT